MSEIVIFEDSSQPVEVRLEGESLWATQKQIGELFDTTPENVLMHLRNIFREKELSESATAKEFLVVRQEGKRQVRRRLKHYNLDAVISVGYRVNYFVIKNHPFADGNKRSGAFLFLLYRPRRACA